MLDALEEMKLDDLLVWRDLTPTDFWDATRNQPAVQFMKFKTFQYIAEGKQKLYIVRVE